MRVRIVAAIQRIPRGKVSTYGAVARGAGYPGAARQVVGVLHRSLGLPWHRVLGAGGEIKLRGDSAIEQRFEFKRGPVFANVVLADEINRTTPKTQSALLEAMNEGQVTVDSHSFPLPQPFLVIATQNPVEHHGTYPLPESQMDRFLMRVRMGYPDGEAEREILRSQGGAAQLENLEPVLTGADVLEMQHAVTRVRVDESLVSYTLQIVRKTRDSEHLSLGVSPRGSQMLYRAAQASAFLDGRDFCTPEDFKPLVVPVFAHRVAVSTLYSSTLKTSEQTDQVVRDIVESVPVPL